MPSNPRIASSLSALVAATALACAGGIAAADPAKAGFFTADQATQGHQDFNNHCAECHRPDLTGGAGVPPLLGKKFLSAWGSQKVSDLITFEHQNMPANNPGAVPDDKLYKITAYILQKNGFPAGSTPLSAATANRVMKK